MKPLFTKEHWTHNGSPQGFCKVTFIYKRKHTVEVYPVVEFDPSPWSHLNVLVDGVDTEEEEGWTEGRDFEVWCEYGDRAEHALYYAACGDDMEFHELLKSIIDTHLTLLKEAV